MMASQSHHFHPGGEPSSHSYPSLHHPPFGSAAGCDPHGPSHIVAQLQQHIARLETELAHERGQRAAAQHANTYIVENLVKTLQPNRATSDDSDMRKELTLAKRQNQALKTQLALARQEVRKSKAKARLLLTHLSVPKLRYEDSMVTGSTHSLSYDIPRTTHTDVGALINLLEDSDDSDTLGLGTPSLTANEGSPSKHDIPLSSNDGSPIVSKHTDQSEAVTVTGALTTDAKLPSQTPSHVRRPNYVHYSFEHEEAEISTRKLHAGSVLDTPKAAHEARQIPQARQQLGDDTEIPTSQSNWQHHATETGTPSQPRPSGLPGLGASSWATEKERPTNPSLGQSRWSRGESPPQHDPPHGSSAFPHFKMNVPQYYGGPFPTEDIYDSPDECRTAIFINQQAAGPQDLRFPDLFRFGLFYKPVAEDRNVFRTVIIDNLPTGVVLAQVMENVRGGPLQSARLLDTKHITGHMTVMIVFLHERSASTFAAHVSKNPITFDGEQARITHLRTPTWPLNQSRSHAVSHLGQTRCLLVRGVPDTLSYTQFRAQLQASSELKRDLVQNLKKLPDGSVQIVFEDVFAAGSAYGKLTTFHIFRNCRVAFARDPCDQPVHTLGGSPNSGADGGMATGGGERVSEMTPLLDYGDDADDGGSSKHTTRSKRQYVTSVMPAGALEHQAIEEKQTKLVDVAASSETGSIQSDHPEESTIKLEDKTIHTTEAGDDRPLISSLCETPHDNTPLLGSGGSSLRRLKSYDSLDTVVEGPVAFNSVNGQSASGASVLVH